MPKSFFFFLAKKINHGAFASSWAHKFHFHQSSLSYFWRHLEFIVRFVRENINFIFLLCVKEKNGKSHRKSPLLIYTNSITCVKIRCLHTQCICIGKSKIFHYYLIFMLCQCVQAKIECVTSIIVWILLKFYFVVVPMLLYFKILLL